MNTIKYLISRLFIHNKTLISFRSHGCQGTIEEYIFTGKIIGSSETERTKYYPHEYEYIVKILHTTDSRYEIDEITSVPAWYCTERDNIVIHID